MFETREITMADDQWKVLDDIVSRTHAGIGTLAGGAIARYFTQPEFIALRKELHVLP
jgi:hypothetical protein